MNLSLDTLQAKDLWARLLEGQVQVIDVRAPVEFAAGSLPASVNRPILNDNERALVGTTYKIEGPERAIELGHRLVSGATKEERIQAWVQTYSQRPEHTVMTCFRGGLRSQLAQSWMRERGYALARLDGGYKKMRQFLMDELAAASFQNILVLTGKTGAGKTQFLRESAYPSVNLELLARHRGSAFGAYPEPQPTQINYENELALALGKTKIRLLNRPLLVEDESRMIGSIVQPEAFFLRKRDSPVLVLNESLEDRIENTYQEYVVSRSSDPELFLSLRASIQKIQAKLGGLRSQEILGDLGAAETHFRETGELSPSRRWIEKLLAWYYDPLYEKSFLQRRPQVLAQGGRSEIHSYLASIKTS